MKASILKAGELGISVCIAILDSGGHLKAFHRMDGAWLVRKNFETNVFSALDFTQRVVRNWVAAGIHGKVVFVSSVVGLLTVPPIPAYAASKHAVQSIAEAMRIHSMYFGCFRLKVGL
jgi:NAD(P)-dependent dehydrogenase (short-subunit alcohol dehydrogenase family)